MAEELQNLLERIQKDGFEKAQADADNVLATAKAKADKITSDAEKKAKDILEKAEKDGLSFTERGKSSLEQAARDAVLSVGEAVSATMKKLVETEISEAMKGDTLASMLIEVVKAYCKGSSKDSRIDILLPPDQKEKLTSFFVSKFKEETKKGLEIKSDSNIISGFKVSVVDDKIEHDFSGDAITEALCYLLRPHIAEVVKSALQKKELT